MKNRFAFWLGWTAVAITVNLFVVLSINRTEQELQRFTGERLSASVSVNNNDVHSAIVIRTGSGAYVVKFSAKEYFVERTAEGWQVGTWIVAAPNEGHTPGPPLMALVFPPDARIGDWNPALAVAADKSGAPTRIDFRLLDGRRIRIDL